MIYWNKSKIITELQRVSQELGHSLSCSEAKPVLIEAIKQRKMQVLSFIHKNSMSLKRVQKN